MFADSKISCNFAPERSRHTSSQGECNTPGRFFITMRYTKQAIPLVQQIDTLKQRGLIIDNETEAERMLSLIGYFRLAEYWRVMEHDKVQHVFKPNSHFDNVLTLYRFDGELKMCVFSAIQKLEVAMRAKVKLMPRPWITIQPQVLKSLYPNLCCIAYWLRSIDPQTTFVADLKALLEKYPTVNPIAMGFPQGWQEEPLWQ